MNTNRTAGNRGFTLVELLVTISIIAIMASLFLGGMYSSQEAARVAATKATIAKINNLIMQRYESYRTRRVPLPFVNLAGNANWPIISAGQRLDALRELMRCEMPDRWSDIINPSGDPSGGAVTQANTNDACFPAGYNISNPPGTYSLTNRFALSPPSLLLAFVRKFNAMTVANQNAGNATIGATGPFVISGNRYTPSPANEAAECLYMICTTGFSDDLDDRDQFRDVEIGDIDGDGAPEFKDGWGYPITWLRWAPGFRSELQTQLDPDPFDPRYIYPSVTGASGASSTVYAATSTQTTPTFALFPLIISAGPDHYIDIIQKYSNAPSYVTGNNDPFYSWTPTFAGIATGYVTGPNGAGAYGAIYDTDGPNSAPDGILENADNITNHLMGTK